jgi:hypothetical protein
MYWGPAVDRASDGPFIARLTGVLSVYTVVLGEETTPAALRAESTSDSGPSG